MLSAFIFSNDVSLFILSISEYIQYALSLSLKSLRIVNIFSLKVSISRYTLLYPSASGGNSGALLEPNPKLIDDYESLFTFYGIDENTKKINIEPVFDEE